MTREDFEKVVAEVLDQMPDKFKNAMDNIGIVVEDVPTDEVISKMKLTSPHSLLGLYQGIPLLKRGVWYGMAPSMPDVISIYQKNIERICRTEQEIKAKVYEVVIHEIGHYFGMSEDELRTAGY